MYRKASTYLVAISEMFCVKVMETHRKEIHSRKELSFLPPHTKKP